MIDSPLRLLTPKGQILWCSNCGRTNNNLMGKICWQVFISIQFFFFPIPKRNLASLDNCICCSSLITLLATLSLSDFFVWSHRNYVSTCCIFPLFFRGSSPNPPRKLWEKPKLLLSVFLSKTAEYFEMLGNEQRIFEHAQKQLNIFFLNKVTFWNKYMYFGIFLFCKLNYMAACLTC